LCRKGSSAADRPAAGVGALAALAGSPAIGALVAASVAGHDAAALRADGGAGGDWGKGQLLLRAGFDGPQLGDVPGFRDRVFGAQEAGADPAEDVIHDGLGVGDLLVAGPAAGLEADVAELVHQELERDAVLEGEADGSGEAVHEAGTPAGHYAQHLRTRDARTNGVIRDPLRSEQLCQAEPHDPLAAPVQRPRIIADALPDRHFTGDINGCHLVPIVLDTHQSLEWVAWSRGTIGRQVTPMLDQFVRNQISRLK